MEPCTTSFQPVAGGGGTLCELWPMGESQASPSSEGTGAQVGDCLRTTQSGHRGGVSEFPHRQGTAKNRLPLGCNSTSPLLPA